MNLQFTGQPHLGKSNKSNYRNSESMNSLTLGKVLRVHHRSGTADIELVVYNDKLISQSNNEGKYSARITTSSAFYDPSTMTSYGTTRPLREGELVVVAFLDGQKSRPLILGSLPDTTDTARNLLPDKYPLDLTDDRDMREAWKNLTVFRNNSYVSVDGLGGIEYGHPNHSFLKIDHDFGADYEQDYNLDDTFEYGNLNETDPMTGKPREFKDLEASNLPFSLLASFESNLDKNYSYWTRVYNSNGGDFRISKGYAKEKGISAFEILPEGSISIRRSIDSNKPSDKGQTRTELHVDDKGIVHLTRTINGEVVQQIKLEDEITIKHKQSIITLADTKISMTNSSGTGITLDGDNLILKAKGKVIVEEG